MLGSQPVELSDFALRRVSRIRVGADDLLGVSLLLTQRVCCRFVEVGDLLFDRLLFRNETLFKRVHLGVKLLQVRVDASLREVELSLAFEFLDSGVDLAGELRWRRLDDVEFLVRLLDADLLQHLGATLVRSLLGGLLLGGIPLTLFGFAPGGLGA